MNYFTVVDIFFSLRQVGSDFYHAGLAREHEQLINQIYKKLKNTTHNGSENWRSVSIS